MKCPHCLTNFHDSAQVVPLGEDADGNWGLIKKKCSACGRAILVLAKGDVCRCVSGYCIDSIVEQCLIRPKTAQRPRPPDVVPDEFAQDYLEACLVIGDSPKASAALSRRCLQHLLREVAKVKKGNLADEIQQVIDSGGLPSHLIESLDAIGNVGNFAAHPIKSQSSGEIVDVELGEAEWNLDGLEALFDFYLVQPELLRKKRDALNKKLSDAGKGPMK